jgi:hypothetical protein
MPRNRNRRKRRTEAEWTEILRRYESSGLASRGFCRREGLALSSFLRWRRRLGSVGNTEFVELVPTSSPGVPLANWSLDVSLPNGVSLRFQG